jgi:hypothetical protein
MTRAAKSSFGAAICVASLFLLLSPAHGDSPQVVGWVERACIQPAQLVLPAKVDTGAVTCSLHAPDLIEFERDGERWVRFTIVDGSGKAAVIEKKIIGVRRIKRHFGQFQNRPVIRLAICVGNVHKTSEVNLVDRTGFEYPLLIGRNFMNDSLIVNPSATYTVEPSCADH